MSEQSAKTKNFWNRMGAGESYDKEFSGLIGWLKGMNFRIETTWGATLGQPWFWIVTLFLFFDATPARCFPFKYFTDKNIVVGVKWK